MSVRGLDPRLAPSALQLDCEANAGLLGLNRGDGFQKVGVCHQGWVRGMAGGGGGDYPAKIGFPGPLGASAWPGLTRDRYLRHRHRKQVSEHSIKPIVAWAYYPPPFVQAPPKAQKMTLSLSSGACAPLPSDYAAPLIENQSKLMMYPSNIRVCLGTNINTHAAAQHCRTLESVKLCRSLSFHGLVW